MQDKIFYVSCFGFICGVFLRSFLSLDLYLTILIGTIALASSLFFYFVSKNKLGIIVSAFILIFCFGIFRFNMVDVSAPTVFESSLNQKAIFSGKIIDEPNITETNQKLIVEIQNKKNTTKVLITANLDGDFKYGDQVNFEGKLEKPENFITDQNKKFDYINYLRKDGIFYIVRYPKIEVISSGNGNLVRNILFSIKEKFLNKMNLAIKEPESLLMGGLILGEKSAFNESLRQSFVDTGTIHIVALSGYNVTIVAEWIMKLLASFPKNISIGAGIISILLFVLMTGGSSTAIRAGIMATLALFARGIGRNYDVSRALLVA
ncbi:MAG: ComEC family competence protein, partial [Candidatus Paceibacterota bacterium]